MTQSSASRYAKALKEVGACFAVSAEKHVSPNDGFGARPSYHVHPDSSYPHQRDILRFGTLAELREWIAERKSDVN